MTQSQIDALCEALRPFAKEAEEYEGWGTAILSVTDNGENKPRETWYTIHDLRRARTAIANAKAAAAPPHGESVAADPALVGIAEEVTKSGGHWTYCSGCYDTEDGHPTQKYNYSPALQTPIGCGCHECGGLGAVWWHMTDQDVADFEKICEEVDTELELTTRISRLEFVLRGLCKAYAACNGEDHPAYEDAQRVLNGYSETSSPQNNVVGSNVEELRVAAAAIREWMPLTLPENEQGQIHFGRALAEAAAEAIEEFLEPTGKPAQVSAGTVPCPCTLIEQDEDCPIGYPSMLCGICEGKGHTTPDQVTALACEMIKIASDLGEPEDPFAAWESVSLIQSQNDQLWKALWKIAQRDFDGLPLYTPGAMVTTAEAVLAALTPAKEGSDNG
ncbi:hypothetical protein ACXHXM_17035